MNTPHIIKRIGWEQIALIAIVIFSLYLRLYHISGYMTFLGDEGRDVLVVKRMIVDHKFTLLGPTASVGGFFLGPIYYYFMIPFLWAFRLDPVGPAVMVALFGVATVYLIFRFGKELFGSTAGLSAALLYALSPLVIAYSRSSWNPNIVPFFSTLLLFLLYKTVTGQKWLLLFPIGIVIGIGLQLHYLFSFLIIVTFVWFTIYGRRKKYIPYYLLGIGGFVLGYGPFLLFELRHGFPNTRSIFQFLLAGKETGFTVFGFVETMRDVSFRLYGRLVFNHPQPEIWNTLPVWQQKALWLAARISMIGTIVSFINDVRKKKSTHIAALLMLVWLVVVVGLFGFYRRGIYDYYFGIVFALPFLCVGYLLTRLFRYPGLRIVLVGLFAVLIVYNWHGRPFRFPPNNQLTQTKQIAQSVLSKTDGKPFNFALVALFNSDHAYRYFFEIWGRSPVAIENEAIDPERKTVTDQLIVICDTTDCKPLGHPLWEIAGFGRAEIEDRWEVPFVTIYKLIHFKGKGDGINEGSKNI